MGLCVSPRSARRCRPEVGVPLPAGGDARWGPCREGRHDGGWDCAFRSPSGERCRPEVGVPLPAGRDARWGTCREGRHDGGWDCAFRRAPRGGAGPHRENWPEVGVPLPAGRDARWGTCREGRHDGGWVCAVRSPPGSGADRRSAFPCLRGVMLGGVRAEKGVMTGYGTVRFAALCAAVPAPRENWPEVGVPLPAGPTSPAANPRFLSGRRRGGGAFGPCRRGCGESFPRRRCRGGVCSGPVGSRSGR